MPEPRVELCPIDEVPPGERLLFDLDGEPVCLLNVDDEYYAIEHECAHRGGPLCKGDLRVGAGEDKRPRGSATGDGEAPILTCPWHGWEYDVRTGDHLGAAEASLQTYEVIVEERTIFLRPPDEE